MAKTNVKASDYRTDREARVAGGFGASAAVQNAEALLRRAVMANLLWEDNFYQDGVSVTEQIKELVPQVEPRKVAAIAQEARTEQKLRHVPLFLVCECARHVSHRGVVESTLADVIQRPDELTEFLALYWKDGRVPLAAGVKKGLAQAFTKFSAYQLAKYDRPTEIKLRDVMFLVHPKPKDPDQAQVFEQLVNGTLPTPTTWEVALSSGHDKKATWEYLIRENKLGALAFMRNLRNMEQVNVDPDVIRLGFSQLKTERLLPLNFFAAVKAAPRWLAQIEDAMFGSLAHLPQLRGLTHLVIDVSGSMAHLISARSDFRRIDAASAMAVMAREVCDEVVVWATAGSDYTRVHQTQMLPAFRGFGLSGALFDAAQHLGGGGIFTRQCLEYISERAEPGDRTIIFSDSQDCDYPSRSVPKPFSPRNYIVDVSAHTRGIAYDGVWTAEVSGWSEHFLSYIAALETTSLQ